MLLHVYAIGKKSVLKELLKAEGIKLVLRLWLKHSKSLDLPLKMPVASQTDFRLFLASAIASGAGIY